MITENVPLKKWTYYKIGGPARYFAQPKTESDLQKTAEFIRKNRLKYFVLGAGSNLLVDDAGFDGVVIQMGGFSRLKQEGELLVTGAGVLVVQALRLCMAEGLAGLELLAGIPGSMGGVFRMNAGTTLGEIKDVAEEVTAFDLSSSRARTLKKAELSFSYRTQHFLKPHELVTEGKVRVTRAEPKLIQERLRELLEKRKKSQPIEKPSCGSVFKNPDPARGLHAWKCIADAGLRGHQIGKAQISELHTNYIVNLGGASSHDVRALIQLAKKRVLAHSGVELEEEVQYLKGSELPSQP